MNIKRNPLVACLDCAVSVKRTGPAQKLCPDCGYRRKLAYSRRHLRAQRIARGQVVRGSEIACGRCAVVMVKTGVNQKYCTPCAAEQVKEDSRAAGYRHRASRDEAQRERDRLRKRIDHHRRYTSDAGFALRKRLAAGLGQSLQLRHRKGAPLCVRDLKAGRRWQDLLGYTTEDLYTHLEALFLPGMTWENRREWHIDHIRPLASFRFDTPDDPEFREAWALANLQPLWATDNLHKHAIWPFGVRITTQPRG